MKPNTRIINYVSLVQDGIMTVDMVPQDIRNEVTKWVRYFAGNIIDCRRNPLRYCHNYN